MDHVGLTLDGSILPVSPPELRQPDEPTLYDGMRWIPNPSGANAGVDLPPSE